MPMPLITAQQRPCCARLRQAAAHCSNSPARTTPVRPYFNHEKNGRRRRRRPTLTVVPHAAAGNSDDTNDEEEEDLRMELERALGKSKSSSTLPAVAAAAQRVAEAQQGTVIARDDDGDEEEGDEYILTGPLLRKIVFEKWGASYDVRINRRRNSLGQLKFYVQVMWKFLEQKSFPLTEDQYDEQLAAVADLVTEWGCAEHLREEIAKTNKRPVIGHTVGGGAKCVSIPLPIEV
ncbi:DUF3067 domain-containing protein [Pseudoscourfieldia marina]